METFYSTVKLLEVNNCISALLNWQIKFMLIALSKVIGIFWTYFF